MAEVVGLDSTAADLRSMTHNHHVTLVAITILVYDFILSFQAEVERFWFIGRVNCAICLFFLNRYLVFFGYVPILIESFWVNDEPMKLKMSVPDVITFNITLNQFLLPHSVQLIIGVILIMRIYALYRRDLRVLVFLIVMSVILFVLGCWAGFGYNKKLDVKEDVLVHVGCGIALSHYRAERLAITWGLLFIFDFTIFGMTLYKTLIFSRSNNANTLITVFMQDGAMYFGVVAACNVLNIIFLVSDEALGRPTGVILSNALSSVLVTRMMLNLRDPTFIPVSERDESEDTTYPDLTIVESHYPTQLSVRGGFTETESRVEDDSEAWDRDLNRPTVGRDIEELHRTGT